MLFLVDSLNQHQHSADELSSALKCKKAARSLIEKTCALEKLCSLLNYRAVGES